MTIDELNALTTLTAADEVPVWDSEESGEPTKKITARNLAASVKSLADLPNTTEMNDAIQQSTAIETLYQGSFNTVDATIQLSHPVTDYNFVLLDFRTNSEHTWQLIPTALLPIGNQPIHATIVGNNTSGKITYPPNYNASINVQFATASTIKCTMSIYNNPNFRVSLYGVYGLYKK